MQRATIPNQGANIRLGIQQSRAKHLWLYQHKNSQEEFFSVQLKWRFFLFSINLYASSWQRLKQCLLFNSFAGNWIFCNRRWLCPSDPEDRFVLENNYACLAAAFPPFAAACTKEKFLRHLSEVTAVWESALNGSNSGSTSGDHSGECEEPGQEHGGKPKRNRGKEVANGLPGPKRPRINEAIQPLAGSGPSASSACLLQPAVASTKTIAKEISVDAFLERSSRTAFDGPAKAPTMHSNGRLAEHDIESAGLATSLSDVSLWSEVGVGRAWPTTWPGMRTWESERDGEWLCGISASLAPPVRPRAVYAAPIAVGHNGTRLAPGSQHRSLLTLPAQESRCSDFSELVRGGPLTAEGGTAGLCRFQAPESARAGTWPTDSVGIRVDSRLVAPHNDGQWPAADSQLKCFRPAAVPVGLDSREKGDAGQCSSLEDALHLLSSTFGAPTDTTAASTAAGPAGSTDAVASRGQSCALPAGIVRPIGIRPPLAPASCGRMGAFQPVARRWCGGIAAAAPFASTRVTAADVIAGRTPNDGGRIRNVLPGMGPEIRTRAVSLLNYVGAEDPQEPPRAGPSNTFCRTESNVGQPVLPVPPVPEPSPNRGVIRGFWEPQDANARQIRPDWVPLWPIPPSFKSAADSTTHGMNADSNQASSSAKAPAAVSSPSIEDEICRTSLSSDSAEGIASQSQEEGQNNAQLSKPGQHLSFRVSGEASLMRAWLIGLGLEAYGDLLVREGWDSVQVIQSLHPQLRRPPKSKSTFISHIVDRGCRF